MKNFKKKSLKAKVGIVAAALTIILLLVYVVYSNFKPEPPVEYDMTQVTYGTITDSLDVSGTVESGLTENFLAIQGVVVEEVLVDVGDSVKKGDKIATFDVSSATEYLNKAKSEYDKALQEYNDTISSSQTNANRKEAIKVEIEKLSSQISAKEKEVAQLTEQIENSTTGETAPIPDEQIDMIAMQMLSNGASLMQVIEFKKAASQVELPVVDEATQAKQTELMQKNLELAQLNSQLSALYAEDVTTMATDSSIIDALKAMMDAKKVEYDKVKTAYDAMKNGWYAQNDGIVSAVNIKAGEPFVPVKESSSSAIDISSLLGGSVDSDTANLISGLLNGSSTPLGSGVIVESYDNMIVSVTVGKSDLLKVKKGMKAEITSLDSKYEGEIIYVGAKAADSSGGIDLGSITSLIGGSSGASGAVVKIKINNPDSKIVVGFDVDIKIILGTLENVLTVPVESVIYNSGVYSVFVYDKEEGTASKRKITKGLLDDTNYEVILGLTEGEYVIKSPDPNMEDGTAVKEKNA
ncbi:MAG: hypothetical protein IKV25_01940 [Clostridia bacterium]|nr:hypothetical protein [Clostridia bacterium]